MHVDPAKCCSEAILSQQGGIQGLFSGKGDYIEAICFCIL